MEIINYSNYKFNKMKRYILHNSITSTECQLFFMPAKDKWETTIKLFKKFYIDSGEYFGNKLLTINSLVDNKEHIHVPELVLPESLVAIGDKICGYMMPYIDSDNLGVLLSDMNVPIATKIELLQQIGGILIKTARASKYTKNFCLGDVNENNFVVERETGRVRVVDLDSCRIANNEPFPSRYLHAIGRNLGETVYKYKMNEAAVYIPDSNTDMICYNVMILNTLCNGKIYTLNITEFYSYLEYLKSLGFDYDLLDCFTAIYSQQEPKNPLEYLEYIPDVVPRASLTVFRHVYEKKKR